MEKILFAKIHDNLEIGDLPLAEEQLRKLFRFILLTEPNISNLASIAFSDTVQTACINQQRQITVGIIFFLTYIHTPADFRFLLQHEHAHNVINLFLASTDTGPLLALIEKFGYLNFVQDAIINLSLLHTCPSNLPERFYSRPPLTQNVLLQRKPDPKKTWSETLPSAQTLLVSQLLAQEQIYIRTRGLPVLAEITKKLCEIMLMLKPDISETQDMVDQPADQNENGEQQQVEISFDASGIEEGALADISIPTSQGLALGDVEYVLPQLAHYYQEIATTRQLIIKNLEEAILAADVGKPLSSYDNPSTTDLVKMAAHIITPWTTTLANPLKRALYFDVSGSIIKFLSIAADIFLALRDQIQEYYGFSGIVYPLTFLDQTITTKTNFSTRLKAVLEHMQQQVGGGEIFIISDGQFYIHDLLHTTRLINEINASFNIYLFKVTHQETIWPTNLNVKEVGVWA